MDLLTKKINLMFDTLKYNKSQFCKMIGMKNRSVLDEWLNGVSFPSLKKQRIICEVFRFPKRVFENDCNMEEFEELITAISKDIDIVICDGLDVYTYKKDIEKNGRVKIYDIFPSSAYNANKHLSYVLDEDYSSVEFYTLVSFLSFGFNSVGISIKNSDKVLILERMIQQGNNLNKSFYLFDSFNKDISRTYRFGDYYIDIKSNIVQITGVLENSFLEVYSKKFTKKIAKNFITGSNKDHIISKDDTIEIFKLLKDSLHSGSSLKEFLEKLLLKKPKYQEMFMHSLSADMRSAFE